MDGRCAWCSCALRPRRCEERERRLDERTLRRSNGERPRGLRVPPGRGPGEWTVGRIRRNACWNVDTVRAGDVWCVDNGVSLVRQHYVGHGLGVEKTRGKDGRLKLATGEVAWRTESAVWEELPVESGMS